MSIFEQFFDVPQFDYDLHKTEFIQNLDMLRSMTVQEQTLYKKYREVNDKHAHSIDKARQVKAKIWTPSDISNLDSTLEEFDALKPAIRWVEGPRDESDWLMLRVFSHTMNFDQNPGRFLKFLVFDEVTERYLGAVSLGSDVISIKCRDEWIGWDRTYKITSGRLANSAIGTCIMATQPFGYNFLGGKLVASLLTTQVVANAWERVYGNRLVGLTTTSLYGSESMYNSIPFWKKLGSSSGKVVIKPDDSVYDIWHHWIKDNKWDEYDSRINKEDSESGPVTGIKQHILSMIFKELGLRLTDYQHGFERGVYYAPLYENTREFLRGDISESSLIPSAKLKRDRDAVLEWWTPKARKRFETLHSEKRYKPEILFYTRLLGATWDEAKQYYLSDVGR